MEREHHNLEHHGGADPIGTIVAERYRLLDCLGQGGSGITYAAEDLQTNQRVALKALLLCHMDDWKQLELFEREATILKQLQHPAIPKYLNYFEVDTERDRAFYIAQELAEGKPLATKVAEGWRTTEQGVRKIAEQVLEILSYLHRLDPPVIHRDIKPQNLILSDSGKLSLVDFGAVQDTYRSTMVKGSTVIGTYGYMAPEQFRGQAVPASDLYGLGATLLFLLTHRAPSDLPQERLRINFRKRVQISPAFADWLEKLLEPDVDDRFPSAPAALTALRTKVLTSKPTRPLPMPVLAGMTVAGLVTISLLVTFRYQIMGQFGIFPPLENICAANLRDIEHYIDAYGNKPNFKTDLLNCQHHQPETFGALLELLIKKGIDINTKSSDGNPLLILAIRFRNPDSVKLLISKGVDINAKSVDGWSPLLLALENKDTEIATLLISKGADINVPDPRGQTSLMKAISIGNPELAKLLILKGADVNTKDNKGATSLILAVDAKNTEFAKLLISKGVDVSARDNRSRTPLTLAIKDKNTELAKLLISKGANVRAPTYDNWTPLALATHNKDTELARLLISKGADVNVAIYQGVIKANEINTKTYNRWTPLMLAIDTNNTELAKLLISKGADVNAQDYGHWTPLLLAIDTNNTELAKLLISKGADVKAKASYGWTPLMLAVDTKNTELAKLLISKGSDVNAQASNGWTPLLLAIDTNNTELAKLLISKGADVKADVKAKASYGWTPLLLAIDTKNTELAKLLISKGADVNAKTSDGLTPLMLARSTRNTELVELLVSKGAKE